jgi:hypothetical protein
MAQCSGRPQGRTWIRAMDSWTGSGSLLWTIGHDSVPCYEPLGWTGDSVPWTSGQDVVLCYGPVGRTIFGLDRVLCQDVVTCFGLLAGSDFTLWAKAHNLVPRD